MGRHLADASLWIAMTSFLSTFSVHKAIDEHGKEIPVAPKFTSGLSTSVKVIPSLQSSADLTLLQSSREISLPNCTAVPRYICGEADGIDWLMSICRQHLREYRRHSRRAVMICKYCKCTACTVCSIKPIRHEWFFTFRFLSVQPSYLMSFK